LDDATIVRNAAPAAGDLAALTNPPNEFPMNVSVAAGAAYVLDGNVSVATSRTLSLDGRLDAGLFTIGGTGALLVNGTGTLASAVNQANGLGATVVTTGANVYSDGSIIDYDAAGDQTINATFHPGASLIHTSGSGTKTLSGDETITANSGPFLY